MAIVGMDPDAIQAAASSLARDASELGQLMVRIGATIDGTPWFGPDRALAADQLHDRVLPSIRDAITLIDKVAAQMMADAQAQLDTSAT